MMIEINVDDFLAECTDDYVGLWSLVRDVRQQHPEWNPDDIKFNTLELLENLLLQKKIVAGMFSNDQVYEKWNLSVRDIINKIQLEWDSLGRDPDIGEIVWFTLIQ